MSRRVNKPPKGVQAMLVANFPTWRTVTLGTQKTSAALSTALAQGDCRVSGWADQLLAKITLAPQPMQLELVKVAGAQLGQTENETLDQICERAAKFALGQCPAEVGPELREQYKDQPMGEALLVAMDPISGSNVDGSPRPCVFDVARDEDDQWLDASYASPDRVWRPGDQWVFVRSKSA